MRLMLTDASNEAPAQSKRESGGASPLALLTDARRRCSDLSTIEIGDRVLVRRRGLSQDAGQRLGTATHAVPSRAASQATMVSPGMEKPSRGAFAIWSHLNG